MSRALLDRLERLERAAGVVEGLPMSGKSFIRVHAVDPNGQRVIEALTLEDLVVVDDAYLNSPETVAAMPWIAALDSTLAEQGGQVPASRPPVVPRPQVELLIVEPTVRFEVEGEGEPEGDPREATWTLD